MEPSFYFFSLLFSPLLSPDSKGLEIFVFHYQHKTALCLLFALRASGSQDSFGDAAAEPTCQRGAAGGSFCSSSWIPILLLLKPPKNSGLGATISSALHGLSLLHP